MSKLSRNRYKIEVVVEFESYDNKRKNVAAKSAIGKWLREAIENKCSYIPFYVEKDENGSAIEACTRKTKISVRPASRA